MSRTPVLCCCDPNNEIGTVPTEAGHEAGLQLRECTDGTVAFDSQDDEQMVRGIEGFEEARGGGKGSPDEKKTWKEDEKKKGTKTWKSR